MSWTETLRYLWILLPELMPAPLYELGVMVVAFLGVVAFIVLMVLFMIWFERKVLGHIQVRRGPLHTGGWHGWAQPIADAVKLLLKEDIVPTKVDRPVYILAPLVVFMSTIVVYVVIPFSERLVARDINMGVLLVFAVSSVTTIGIFMAGWGSNNKYSLLGAMRAAAQIVSYEVPLLLSVLGVFLLAQTLSLRGIVEAQDRVWFVFLQPLGFIIYVIAGVGEVNRLPFDIPEAESELVAGYMTEYSGLRWAFFFLAEYANMFVISAMATVLFLGGWRGPVLPGIVWFLGKAFFFMFLMVWVRGTYPRLRVDQMMSFCWKVLLPLAFLNLLATGFVAALV
ncbi:MAG: NADH-quinone oxidoreductase subunit NuoH [Candidatus Eisenbacteria bacterium]